MRGEPAQGTARPPVARRRALGRKGSCLCPVGPRRPRAAWTGGGWRDGPCGVRCRRRGSSVAAVPLPADRRRPETETSDDAPRRPHLRDARRGRPRPASASRTRPASRSASCPTVASSPIEHRHERGRTLINQVLGSPLDGGIARLYLRVRAPEPVVVEAVGPGARVSVRRRRRPLRLGGRDRRRAPPRLALAAPASRRSGSGASRSPTPRPSPVSCDSILVQDLGLGDRGFLMNNEAYASQYIDHHVARHPRCGPVVMSRQNLAQGGAHPWVAHGCLEGAAGFATDAMQLLGPRYRDAGEIDPGREPAGPSGSSTRSPAR